MSRVAAPAKKVPGMSVMDLQKEVADALRHIENDTDRRLSYVDERIQKINDNLLEKDRKKLSLQDWLMIVAYILLIVSIVVSVYKTIKTTSHGTTGRNIG